MTSEAASASVTMPSTPSSAPVSAPIELSFRDWTFLPWRMRYAEITLKEKLAIKVMESIPRILQNNNMHGLDGRQPISPAIYFSPTRLPLQDRMALIFSNTMTKARQEAAAYTAPTNQESSSPNTIESIPQSLCPEEVMTVDEVDSFLSNVELVPILNIDTVHWIRRYWRTIQPSEKRDEAEETTALPKIQAIVGRALPLFTMPSIQQSLNEQNEHANNRKTPHRVLIAEARLDRNGNSLGGWWNDRLLYSIDGNGDEDDNNSNNSNNQEDEIDYRVTELDLEQGGITRRRTDEMI